jgi:hypothetical protein
VNDGVHCPNLANRAPTARILNGRYECPNHKPGAGAFDQTMSSSLWVDYYIPFYSLEETA